MNRAWIACLLSLVAACGGEDAAPAAGGDAALEQAVYTTFHPTTWMAEEIAGGLVPVVCPLPAGEDPIFWRPERETLARYARARLVVVNGAGLEKWVETASLPPSRGVDSARAFADEWLTYAAAPTPSHGGSGAHTHTGLDGHTWLDPIHALEQSRAILDAMCAAFPAHADAFRANHAEVARELSELDAAFADLAPKLRDVNVIASHPAYDYLARRYAFDVTNLDLDPESALDAESQAALEGAVQPGVRNLLLWESAPSEAALAAVPATVRSIVVTPAENPESGEAFPELMRANAARIAAALAE